MRHYTKLYRYLLTLTLIFIGSVFTGLGQQNAELISGGVVVAPEPDVAEIPDSLRPVRLQSPIFRDTMPLSRMSAISIVAPGFSQLYNRQYWKIPVLYGTVGGFSYFYANASKEYKRYSKLYDQVRFESYPNDDAYHRKVDPVARKMYQYNTQRQVFLAGAALTYLYFLGDGVINYANEATPVKKATTLAMIFPGAGQIYNKSYWKVPIVVGAFATMGYIIDFNSRGYKRTRDAYNNYGKTDDLSWFSQSQIQNMRDQYRRNRDLSIIITAAFYLLSVVEAHVDAWMKDFDVSDELALRVEPTLIDVSKIQLASTGSSGYPGMGLSLKWNF